MNWEGSKYLWNVGIGQVADKGPHKVKTPEVYFAEAERIWDANTYSNLKPGDIIWINCQLIHNFCAEILPTLNVPIVVVIADGDNTFPSDCMVSQEGVKFGEFDADSFIGNPNIVHIFAQNCDYTGNYKDKVTKIPIGIDFHTVAYRRGGWQEHQQSPAEQNRLLELTKLNAPPIERRSSKIWSDFHHSDTAHGGFRRYLQFKEDRKSIFEFLNSMGLIEHSAFLKRSHLWRMKVEHAFTISPHGNGLDCHRTWEDLTLGCIVIVKTSPLDPLYENLPVIIVKDWADITRSNVLDWFNTYKNKSFQAEKLVNSYWINMIESKARPYKR